MSDAATQSFHSKSVLMVLLFVLASLGPVLTPSTTLAALDDEPIVQLNAPFSLTSGYGHELAGTLVNVDGLVNAVVREESMFDYWHSVELNNSSTEHHGTPDMELTRYDVEHYCWSTEEGYVRTAVHRPNGYWASTLVDTVAASNASSLVDCAIGVTANELPRVLYADGDDLKMGRYARQSSTYWDGPRWHTRTILEDVAPTHLELEITPTGVEWGLMRTATGALHQVNFSGAYWTTYLLDNGPVGEDFELAMDANGTAHILYSRVNAQEIVLMRVTGMERDVRILERNANLVDALGMDLDANAIEQIATAYQNGATFTINLIRSLDGQDSGRVDPTPTQLREGEEDENEGSMLLADLNADGFDDLVVATPEADLLTFTNNGRVDVYYGSETGLETIPSDILAGDMTNASFGAGIDVGDFNNDGVMDLAVGVPGWYPASRVGATDGQVLVYLGGSNGLTSNPWWTANGSDNESLGSTLRALDRINLPSSLAVAAHGYSMEVSASQTDQGKVNIYDGGELGLTHVRNLTQSKAGEMFGRALEGCDVNGDGHEELMVSNTGSYEDPLSYSSIEYFYGSASGYSGTPDHSIEPLTQGRLFGFNMVCVGDINGDGLEDHIITEPYNTTSGVFGTGVLWLYEGTNGSLPVSPDWQYLPTIANAKVGEAIAPAGDINEDGYGDVYITSRMGSQAGRVEIFLGSADGLRSDRQLLADGNSSERLGYRLASNGDVNGDGLSELVYSQRTTERGTAFALNYLVVSERDWESISFDYTGDLNDLELATAARGETSMVFTHEDSLRSYITKLEHMNDGTPSGQWVNQILVRSTAENLTFQFAVYSSGQPVLLTEDDSAMNLHTTSSMTAVQQDIATTGTMGQYLGSNINKDNEQVLAYTSGSGNQIYASEQTSTGWATDLVRTGAVLANGIEVVVDSANIPHLVYRHSGSSQLEMAVGGSSWSLTTIGSAGDAVSVQHPALMLSNDTLAVALLEDNGNGTDLALWMHDGANFTTQTIANQSDLNTQLALTSLTNGSILVASLNSTGSLNVYEQWPGDSAWQTHTVTQPSGTVNEYRLDLVGGDQPLLAVRANAVSALMMLNETGTWNTVAERPAAAVDGAWDVQVVDDHLLLLTSDPTTNHLVVNTVELDGIHQGFAPWMSVRFGDVVTGYPVDAVVDSNGTVHMAYWNEVENDAVALRLYADQDRDLVFDLIDAMPAAGNQWKNSDGDNYGDNPLGPLPDQCPSTSGTSAYVVHGCEDYDTDGFADSIDSCDAEGGTSWIDRFGCGDLDQDGWSDNNVLYYDGDIFKGNWKQALDTDGDGYGDNHGVDCCSTAIEPNAGPGDLFPYLASQYADTDGDGFGDNDTDSVYGDFCPWDYGVSWRDRNGCLDSDGDGASDPSDEGTFFEWNISNGADVWPFDPTQWVDTDGDGFGDNQSDNATNPDRFPYRAAAANDTDGDGYADNWTALYNGTNAQGIQIDACPEVWGNSSFPVVGCLDSDGDAFMDQYSYDFNETSGLRENQVGDAFPFIKSQWLDTDGDGFGDNPNGFEADECPYEFGVVDGTYGVGCRLIDIEDNDGDGVINDLDVLCPNSPIGEPVNEEGCAQSELDDDDDGVKNNADLCPDTPASTSVDSDGCSTEQRTSDSDGDGLNDPDDRCPNTEAGQNVDENGCSQGQRDSDGDGLSDLEDACDDTPPGFPILANGCTDESALTVDIDGDGYAGLYTYDIDPLTGLHVNQTGDAFPSDPTQWFDQDGDGYGDNSTGNNADHCPDEHGTSYLDFLGCYDDGDGWWDENEPPSLRDNPTQWKDSDFDGFGDNWGNPDWTALRDPSWPGQFVEGATNADFCPKTTIGLQVDEEGCHISERDSDLDGVMDDSDNCPNEPKGVDGYDDGCPYVPLSGDGDAGLFGVDAGTLMVVLGGGGLLVVLVLLVIMRMMREDEDDEDDDDDYFDDDEEEESFLDKLDKQRAAPKRDRSAPAQRASSPSRGPASPSGGRGGPGGSPPGRGGPGGGPGGSPPGRGAGGPPQRGPSSPPGGRGGPSPASSSGASQKVAKKKSVSSAEESSSAKVRKAKIQVDLSIFEDWQEGDRTSAVDWVVGAFADGEAERTVLMQLQETGWTAEQSRAICNLAKNKGA